MDRGGRKPGETEPHVQSPGRAVGAPGAGGSEEVSIAGAQNEVNEFPDAVKLREAKNQAKRRENIIESPGIKFPHSGLRPSGTCSNSERLNPEAEEPMCSLSRKRQQVCKHSGARDHMATKIC